MKKRPVHERFDEKLNRNAPNGCWEWTGAIRGGTRYGSFGVRSYRTVAPHRFAYERAYGAIPEGMCVCHRCDNPICCNPDHLFLGTHTDNMRDKVAKGRHVPVQSKRVLAWRDGSCVRGHDITDPANVRTHANGSRTCRACVRLTLNARRAARRASHTVVRLRPTLVQVVGR